MRGTKTKAIALGMLDYLIHENDQTFMLFRNFLTKEPLNGQYEGVKMLLGRGSFTQDIDDKETYLFLVVVEHRFLCM